VVLKEGHGRCVVGHALSPVLDACHQLFRRPGEPIRVTHRKVAKLVVAHSGHAFADDIYRFAGD
jgi:hypothetical protein